MLKPEKKQELTKKFDDVKKEIKRLRDRLIDLNNQKEAWFEKKEKTNREISKYIKQTREFKSQRDSLTKDVKEIKEKRKEHNEKIKKNIDEIKRLEKEKMEIIKKYNLKGDPSRIKEEIDRLERIIETEAPSFEKEKEIMKKIKELKKNYKEAEQVSNVWEKINGLSKETERLQQLADEVHKKVQGKASSSQQKHEEMLATIKKLKELEEKKAKEYEKFIGYKRSFVEVNNQLKEKLAIMNELNKILSGERERIKLEKKLAIEATLKSKEEQIEDKIKKKKKLTTEDLLVFQQIKEE